MKKILVLPIVALFFGLACSEGNPIAPTGTVLTVTASPNRIGRTGTTTINVTGRKPDGNPIADGTDIFFSTTIGSIDNLVEADASGQAMATLTGDGRIGTAQVTVSLVGSSSGGSSGGDGSGDGGSNPSTVTGTNSVTISIQVGSTPTLSVVINPDNVQINSQASVTVVAQNEDGAPVGLETVTLVTNLGSLNPTTPVLDSNGIATATLRTGTQAGTAMVQAFLNGISASGTATIRDAINQIALDADPRSITNDSAVDISISATAINSQDQPVAGNSILFTSTVGTFSPTNTAITNSQGRAEVTLRLTQDQVRNNSSVTVTGRSSTAEGSVTISINVG